MQEMSMKNDAVTKQEQDLKFSEELKCSAMLLISLYTCPCF